MRTSILALSFSLLTIACDSPKDSADTDADASDSTGDDNTGTEDPDDGDESDEDIDPCSDESLRDFAIETGEVIMDGEVISADSLADLRECANLFNGYRAGSRERYCVEACERDHLSCGYDVLPGGEGVCQPDEMADCVDSATACVRACPFIEAESEG